MANLVVTLTEAVTLNGAARGSTNAVTISGVNDIYHRIVSCPDDVPLSLATFNISLRKFSTIQNSDGSKYPASCSRCFKSNNIKLINRHRRR